MNIKLCKGISVEKDIYGSRDYFCQEDIVRVTAVEYNGESKTIKGRFCDAFRRDMSLYIQLDTSTKYHKNHIDIPTDSILSIEKVPD